ncbi:hypothetical protein LSAT2_028705 [Lamellibrachia satsuma]|nr:hypothetical protein LSAT2_028705 [Lamellibrachia satsuma]
MWYTLFAIVVVSVVGTIVSFLTGAADPKEVDPRLLTPVVDSFFCCLPAKFRRAIQCNIDRTLDADEVNPISQSPKRDETCHTNEALSTETQL